MLKNFLFVLRRSAYVGRSIHESLDMLMTVAAFDQAVRVLFLDDGVFLLKSGQAAHSLELKAVAPMLAALELYDVQDLWVEEESLLERGLSVASLSQPVQRIRRAEVAELVRGADIVVDA